MACSEAIKKEKISLLKTGDTSRMSNHDDEEEFRFWREGNVK